MNLSKPHQPVKPTSNQTSEELINLAITATGTRQTLINQGRCNSPYISYFSCMIFDPHWGLLTRTNTVVNYIGRLLLYWWKIRVYISNKEVAYKMLGKLTLKEKWIMGQNDILWYKKKERSFLINPLILVAISIWYVLQTNPSYKFPAKSSRHFSVPPPPGYS